MYLLQAIWPLPVYRSANSPLHRRKINVASSRSSYMLASTMPFTGSWCTVKCVYRSTPIIRKPCQPATPGSRFQVNDDAPTHLPLLYALPHGKSSRMDGPQLHL